MNKLSYRLGDYDIVLLVDGDPICNQIDFDDRTSHDLHIPGYLFETLDIPLSPDCYKGQGYHIIGVCPCGEDECGSTYCKINKNKRVC